MLEWIWFILGICWVFEFLLACCDQLKALLITSKFIYRPGSWALITGSTDGIGKGFALVLAKKGLNIIQVSRSPSKLASVASDLSSKYGIQVKNIVKDFNSSSSDPISFFSDIYSQTKGLDISIIVNNVGISNSLPFLQLGSEGILNFLAVNTFPLVFLTRLYVSDVQKKKGVVINLSSVQAELLFQNKILYNATKSFDIVINDTLASEGVNVFGLQPGFVRTPLIRGRKTAPLLIEPEECAEGALGNINVVSRGSGHWKHKLTMLLIRVAKPVLIPLVELGLVKVF